MKRFYAQFIQPGELCFDLGAHVGNRLLVWSWLGAQGIGVEPQPACLGLLRRWYGRSRQITLVAEAVGASAGEQVLYVSPRNPTVTTLSQAWIDAVQQSAGFAQVRWEGAVTVQVTTLDELIARYGEPVFCKIDVEGYELEVLRGLSRPLTALSFEYIATTKVMTLACLERLEQLGEYEYNVSKGEKHRWLFPDWMRADALKQWLEILKEADGSGDIYARRKA